MIIDKILRVEKLSSVSTNLILTAYKNGYIIKELHSDSTNDNEIKSEDSYKKWEPLSNEEIKKIKNMVNSLI